MKPLRAGELAKLFNLSKYKIRHYIDQGILTPKRNKENNYYYFEETDIYRLYQINMLREIGFSIKEIQASLKLEDTKPMFEEAEVKIQRKINELLAIQKTIVKIVDSQKTYSLKDIIFIEREERCYGKIIKEVIEDESIDYLKAAPLKIPHLDEPYYVLSENNAAVMCLQSTKEACDYVFPSGTYACKSFMVKDRGDVEKQVATFLSDLVVGISDSSQETLLLYENIHCSLAYNDGMIYSIEVKL